MMAMTVIDGETLSQVRGDTAEWDVTDIRDSVGNLVTTGTVRLVVKPDFEMATEAVIDVTATIDDGAAHLTVPPTATLALPNTQKWMHYDFQVEASAARWTLFRGVYIVQPQVATN